MSDDARQLIDNPYRASHTPIYVGDVNVTDLMARAWDRGFAAGDERLRAMLGKVPREQLGRIMQEVAATPNAPKADVRRWTPAYGPNGSCCYENENGDYVLARDYDDLAAASPDERLREALAFYADKGNYTAQNPVGSGAHVWRDMGQRARAALAADRDSLAEKPETDT